MVQTKKKKNNGEGEKHGALIGGLKVLKKKDGSITDRNRDVAE